MQKQVTHALHAVSYDLICPERVIRSRLGESGILSGRIKDEWNIHVRELNKGIDVG